MCLSPFLRPFFKVWEIVGIATPITLTTPIAGTVTARCRQSTIVMLCEITPNSAVLHKITASNSDLEPDETTSNMSFNWHYLPPETEWVFRMTTHFWGGVKCIMQCFQLIFKSYLIIMTRRLIRTDHIIQHCRCISRACHTTAARARPRRSSYIILV